MKYYFIFIGIFLLASCKNFSAKKQPVFTAKGLDVVIEIPAGTNHKIEYNSSSNQFENDQIDGKTRVIDFLPYPGNYGYIPSTHMDKKRGGDGDALDVLLISESLPTGTTVPTIPIAALVLKDKGEIDTKIIVVPADSTYRVIESTDYQDFLIRYNAAHHIIQEWFMSYKGLGKMELIGWQDEQYAKAEIKKWSKKEDQ